MLSYENCLGLPLTKHSCNYVLESVDEDNGILELVWFFCVEGCL